MNTSVYDTNTNGIVDLAENAQNLGGQPASSYATTSALTSGLATKANATNNTLGSGGETVYDVSNTRFKRIKAGSNLQVATDVGDGNILVDLSSATANLINGTSAALGTKQNNQQYQDEGTNLGTSGTVDTVNFTGAGVTASRAGNSLTINIPGSSSGISSINGLTGSNQTISTDSSLVVNSSGTIHNFSSIDAGVAQRGVISTSAQSFAGNKTFINRVGIGDSVNFITLPNEIFQIKNTTAANAIVFSDTANASLTVRANGTLSNANLSVMQSSSNGLGMNAGPAVHNFSASGNPLQILTSTAHHLGFFTNNIERARFTASGNLGINEISPSERLTVTGNAVNQSGLRLTQLDSTAAGAIANGILGVDAAGVVVKATQASAANIILPSQSGNTGRY